MKMFLDLFLSFFGLLFISPILLIISIVIFITSKGPVFYRQVRVGKKNEDFKIFKFRTMHINADKLGLLTIGNRDPRVTSIGYYLRKYKLDELPQLINVLMGTMSFVGPRPEVRKYVNLYTKEQQKILEVRPGITDLASIEFRNEPEILYKQKNPNQYYIEYILPRKININLDYIKNRTLLKDFKIIFKTIIIIFK